MKQLALVLLSAWSAQEAPTLTLQAPETAPAPAADASARFADWAERDAEGRWALVEADLRADPGGLAAWIATAAAEQDGDLLVWLALTQQYDSRGASEALQRLDDARWLAVSVWRLGFQNSHSFGIEKAALRTAPGVAHAWALMHRAELDPALFDLLLSETSAGASDETNVPDETSASALWEERAARLAGPFDPDELLAVLRSAESAEPFGTRLSAIPGELYDTQVRRALASLANRRVPPLGYVEALLAVARSARPELADLSAAAARAMVQLPSERIPAAELFTLSASSERAPAQREALFLGASYGPDAIVWLHLHALLDEPRALLWTTAVERLAELGDAFTLERVAALEQRSNELVSDQRARLEHARATIVARLEANAAQGGSADPAVAAARADYAESLQHPLAQALRAFAEQLEHAGPK